MKQNTKLTLVLVFSVCTLTINAVSADIYRWYDNNGQVHFSDRSPQTGSNPTILPTRNYKQNQNYGESTQKPEKKLIMYATSWCGYCKKARKYLKQHQIPYTEFDIENDVRAKAEYDRLGAPGVPLFLKGKKHMYGFNEQSFEAFYR